MESEKDKAGRKAIEMLRRKSAVHDAAAMIQQLLSGDRTALSQGITLVESTAAQHRQLADEMLQACLPHSGKSIRIGITGVPGVGKSTFIDAFGMYLIGLGKKVAVLAIDPSSPVSGGSILGDKTRMEKLSMNDRAFIRPSPSSSTLGGVAQKTREIMMLCEAAGYDVIIVETVGVGQSETAVHGMTDFFLLLMLAGAGDQLQGIKRGIMEMCDAMLITKSDGENQRAAQRAKGEYFSALHLFPAKESGWMPVVETCSALGNDGIDRAWETIVKFEEWMTARGLFEKRRHDQDLEWMRDTIKQRLISDFFSDAERMKRMVEIEEQLRRREITPFVAAERILRAH